MSTRSPLAPVRGFPASDALRYRELGLWSEETFAGLIAERTTRFADREAVVGRDAHGTEQRWTYADLAERVERAAAHFAAQGVAQGDRVVHALANTVEYVAVVLGLFRLGALPVFALPAHRERELGEFCATADAAALVLGGTRAEAGELHALVSERVGARGVSAPTLIHVADVLGDVDSPAPERVPEAGAVANQIAFLQLSGGTTGVSKLIPRTHADYLYSVRASAEICGLDADARMLVVLPAAHNFPMSSPGILGVLHVGGCVVLAPDPSPRTAFALVERERVTIASLVPPLAQAWIAAAPRRRPDLSSLRLLQIGGARLAPAVAREVRTVLGVRLQQVFGMAEGLVNYTRAEDPEDLVVECQGRPISDLDEVRVVDAEDRDVPDGSDGELLTRGPYTIRGYYRADRADAESFTPDGYYRTGDLVRRLPSGHIVVTGRIKDQVNRSGEKIACDEIEDLLLAHPGVRDAVAVGVPDPYLGERLAVVVVPASATGPTAGAALTEQLRSHLVAEGLATFKMPDQFAFVDELPTTGVGKNSRRDLRRLLAERLDAPVNPASQPNPTHVAQESR